MAIHRRGAQVCVLVQIYIQGVSPGGVRGVRGKTPREENLRFLHKNDRVGMQFSQAYSEKAESHKLLLSRLL